MDFITYWKSLDAEAKRLFAEKAQTTVGYCNQLAYTERKIDLGLADVFVIASKGVLRHEELPLGDRAKAQHALRKAAKRSLKLAVLA